MKYRLYLLQPLNALLLSLAISVAAGIANTALAEQEQMAPAAAEVSAAEVWFPNIVAAPVVAEEPTANPEAPATVVEVPATTEASVAAVETPAAETPDMAEEAPASAVSPDAAGESEQEEQPQEAQAAEDTQATSVGRRAYRRPYGGYRDLRKSQIEARRDAMENYRSARRWWRNPRAESRRQWNRARSNWQKDVSEFRRAHRPVYTYGRDYRGEYPYGGRALRHYWPH